jgi:hypothetical protein
MICLFVWFRPSSVTNKHSTKAFTSWVNSVLEKVEEKVSDITTDFSDGIKLIHFLELLSGKKIGKKLEENPKNRIQKIQNLHIALEFVKALDVRALGVGAEGMHLLCSCVLIFVLSVNVFLF